MPPASHRKERGGSRSRLSHLFFGLLPQPNRPATNEPRRSDPDSAATPESSSQWGEAPAARLVVPISTNLRFRGVRTIRKVIPSLGCRSFPLFGDRAAVAALSPFAAACLRDESRAQATRRSASELPGRAPTSDQGGGLRFRTFGRDAVRRPDPRGERRQPGTRKRLPASRMLPPALEHSRETRQLEAATERL